MAVVPFIRERAADKHASGSLDVVYQQPALNAMMKIAHILNTTVIGKRFAMIAVKLTLPPSSSA